MIELLVMIEIIAILTAILFSIFAGAREKARQTVCIFNMKQIEMASLMYMENYDGSLFHHHEAWVLDEKIASQVHNQCNLPVQYDMVAERCQGWTYNRLHHVNRRTGTSQGGFLLLFQ